MSTIYLSEKKEYRALDFSKFVAAFLVAAIHIPPFEEAAPVFSHEFQQVICRMAVPFFFVCTGYFIGEKITDKGKVRKYLFHIIKMYVWWSLLYLIPIIERFWEKKRSAAGNLLELARRFFLIGSYIQLWYLPATVVAVLLLYLLVTRFQWKVKGIVAAAVLLYLTGVFHNTYRHVFDTDDGISLPCKGRPDPKKCVWMVYGIFSCADDVRRMDRHTEDRRVIA